MTPESFLPLADLSGPVESLLFLLVLASLLLGTVGIIQTGRLRDELRALRAVREAAPSPAVPAPAAAPAAAPVTAVPAVVPAPAPEAAPDLPVIHLIAAAVHAALDGQAHRILHIEPVSSGWAREGRREIFSSRRVR